MPDILFWKPVENENLWREIDQQIHRQRIRFTHVASRSGDPENDRCDELAMAAYQQYL